jgi:hypothetical protein
MAITLSFRFADFRFLLRFFRFRHFRCRIDIDIAAIKYFRRFHDFDAIAAIFFIFVFFTISSLRYSPLSAIFISLFHYFHFLSILPRHFFAADISFAAIIFFAELAATLVDFAAGFAAAIATPFLSFSILFFAFRHYIIAAFHITLFADDWLSFIPDSPLAVADFHCIRRRFRLPATPLMLFHFRHLRFFDADAVSFARRYADDIAADAY